MANNARRNGKFEEHKRVGRHHRSDQHADHDGERHDHAVQVLPGQWEHRDHAREIVPAQFRGKQRSWVGGEHRVAHQRPDHGVVKGKQDDAGRCHEQYQMTGEVEDPLPQHLELDDGDHEHDDHQHDALGGGQPVIARAKGEGRVVEAVDQRRGRVVRPAAGKNLDLAEGLQRVDGRDHQQKEQGRGQQRKRYPPELGEPAGAVHARRFVKALRDGLQSGQADEHGVARMAPHRHRGDAWQRIGGRGQPVEM